ncbi:hypothetical protein AVEN_195413-1 [Araneus ventricosus]|uniref:Uncharacterized protein n=1 Tax=Araneus ventricosus TaxID=182803 RepID=A0A4Y2K7N4_ARAVE|nr:hypothetical protein AVEN_195413-1 [Araneus ventricosus]
MQPHPTGTRYKKQASTEIKETKIGTMKPHPTGTRNKKRASIEIKETKISTMKPHPTGARDKKQEYTEIKETKIETFSKKLNFRKKEFTRNSSQEESLLNSVDIPELIANLYSTTDHDSYQWRLTNLEGAA